MRAKIFILKNHMVAILVQFFYCGMVCKELLRVRRNDQ